MGANIIGAIVPDAPGALSAMGTAVSEDVEGAVTRYASSCAIGAFTEEETDDISKAEFGDSVLLANIPALPEVIVMGPRPLPESSTGRGNGWYDGVASCLSRCWRRRYHTAAAIAARRANIGMSTASRAVRAVEDFEFEVKTEPVGELVLVPDVLIGPDDDGLGAVDNADEADEEEEGVSTSPLKKVEISDTFHTRKG